MADPQPAQPAQPEPNESRNLIVCGLPQSVDGDDLHRIFSQLGPVVSSKIMVDVKAGGHRGFGFVLFENADDAARAKQTFDGTLVAGTAGNGGKSGRMRVDFAHHDAFNVVTGTMHVFVRNIPPTTTQLDVVRYLTRFGEVISAALRPDDANPGNTAMLSAFVQFKEVSSAKDAVARGTGATPFTDKSVPLLVVFAEASEVRAERRLREQQNPTLPPPLASPVPFPSIPMGQPQMQHVPVAMAPLQSCPGPPTAMPLHPGTLVSPVHPSTQYVAVPPQFQPMQPMQAVPQPGGTHSVLDTHTGRVLVYHPTYPPGQSMGPQAMPPGSPQSNATFLPQQPMQFGIPQMPPQGGGHRHGEPPQFALQQYSPTQQPQQPQLMFLAPAQQAPPQGGAANRDHHQ